MYWLCFYVEVNKTTMTFLLFLFGIFLALGMFLLTADLLRLPRLATQRAMLSVGRQEKKQARSVEALLMAGRSSWPHTSIWMSISGAV